jgi:hypothetical protein
MQHAFAVDDLVVALEQLATDAVPTLVRLLIEIVGVSVVNALDERPNAALVSGLGRPHEAVERDRQALPHGVEARRNLVHEFLWGHATFGRGLRNLLSVLVETGEERDLVAALPVIPRDDVRADLFVRVTDVRITIGVVDRGGQIEFAAGHL